MGQKGHWKASYGAKDGNLTNQGDLLTLKLQKVSFKFYGTSTKAKGKARMIIIYSHTTEYYSAIEKNEPLAQATT